MIPLALANVLVNDLLARSRFAVVPAMVVLAIVYAFHGAARLVQHFPWQAGSDSANADGIQRTVLLAICAGFAWRYKNIKAPVPIQA